MRIFSQRSDMPLLGVLSVCLKSTFLASGIRNQAGPGRAETDLLLMFSSSVPNQPSQEVRRAMASGERFPVVSAPGQSTGLPRKPEETCHSARRSVCRRAGRARELAERVRPGSNRLQVWREWGRRSRTERSPGSPDRDGCWQVSS